MSQDTENNEGNEIIRNFPDPPIPEGELPDILLTMIPAEVIPVGTTRPNTLVVCNPNYYTLMRDILRDDYNAAHRDHEERVEEIEGLEQDFQEPPFEKKESDD
jgi:hypothetical protein